MTAQKFFVIRHPEFHRRAEVNLREYDKTDYNKYIGISPYSSPTYSLEPDYSVRRPPKADKQIKYDHSILREAYDGEVPDEVLDIVEIAVATFAADKAVKRAVDVRADLDESQLETRNIKLQIPVLSSRMASDRMEEMYSEMVSHITHDVFEFEFQQVEQEITVEHRPADDGKEVVSLLSDGLDSVGGIYHNKSQNVSSAYATVNYGHGVKTKTKEIASEAGVDHEVYRVDSERGVESTQFSRGLLHLTFGVAAAVAEGANEVRCFENGIMARFVILSEGWMTTRTVSPLFVTYFNKILESLLDEPVRVENPFSGLTKSEIVDKIPDAELVQRTISCPHSSSYGGQNCGTCVPCLIRNVGILASGHEIGVDELSKYDCLSEADFEAQALSLDLNNQEGGSGSGPEIFLKGITEIAYFCRSILVEEPKVVGMEYPDLLNERVYSQHLSFANSFMEALGQVVEHNPSIRSLLSE